MRLSSVLVAVGAASLSFLSIDASHAKNTRVNYEVQVLRTSYGIPHIQAGDWGSLGYGYGYAFAQDNVCVLAREVLTATGTQSKYFGPGNQNAIRTAATSARVPPNRNGAEGPKPDQPPAPCQSKPAISEAGKAKRPIVAL